MQLQYKLRIIRRLTSKMMRVAVIGGGVSGLAAAYVLAKEGVEVVVYEKENSLGGQAKTSTADGISLDLGFMIFARSIYPDVMEFLESVGVEMEASDISYSVSLDEGQGYEWGTRNGLSSLFAQKKNVFNPWFWNMIAEIIKFKNDASLYIEELDNNPDVDRNETLGQFVQSRGYSELFKKAFLIPICASIWSCSSVLMTFSAYLTLSFLRNHDILELLGLPEGLTSKWHSQSYVNRIKKELESRGCKVKINFEIYSVLTNEEGCAITCKDGLEEAYDVCIIATHAPDAVKILGQQATYDELRILGAFQYAYTDFVYLLPVNIHSLSFSLKNLVLLHKLLIPKEMNSTLLLNSYDSDIFLHHDDNLMPKKRGAWGSRNFLGTTNDKACITYWLNNVQNISEHGIPYLVTLNPPCTPKDTLCKLSTIHPIPSVSAYIASSDLNVIQGKRGLWFCGAYQGYGFPEDGVKAGILAANGLLRRHYSTIPSNPKCMVPSCLETGVRVLVTRFLQRFIATGCLILLEGGKSLTFEGTRRKGTLKVTLRIHKPQFYWKVATEADLGFADAYINGDFSFVGEDEGLLNLFLLVIENTEMNNYASKLNKERVWWRQLLYTSVIASAKEFFKHVSTRNTLSRARRNISRHYDLSNEMFALFLDETMTYSCAIFQNPGEDLKNAQLRKIHTLIEKARITKDHHILEIGCGWGSLALEVVKKTGCKYTGITLAENQLQYIEMKVKEEGLQDRIEILLCDYRQMPNNYKYDRIISCGMIEHAGHEYMEEFFKCCESSLADNGILVLQFIAIADEKYDEWKLSHGFLKEYIFSGSCMPSLSRVISAMAAASRLSVVHLEEIGCHYFHTLRRWWQNFLQNRSLMEEGGEILTFEGTKKMGPFKVILRVRKPQFYWKVATRADLGFADAYIDGDISFADENEGLLNFLLLVIANTEMDYYTTNLNKGRGWWTYLYHTSIVISAKNILKRISRKNTLSQARNNISQHYDLSNELFSLFMDETMLYSNAIFQNPGEDLKNAQLRKVHTLIEKARINKDDHILEIGCGWGTLAVEVVKNTGCKYTGITLSQNQLQYAQSKVAEAGLQDQIEFLLCDYRQLPNNYKYDRIIACEMIEHVGHEFMEEFFKSCESSLAKNGILILQFTAVADEKYEEWRRSYGFGQEYIFHGGCLPSLSRVISAMAAASRLSVVNLEERGSHYYETIRVWRQNFLTNQSKILALGFDEKFIRTWEYYFDYAAAGFKYCIAGNYQIVLTRPGDVAAFGSAPYNPVSSTT